MTVITRGRIIKGVDRDSSAAEPRRTDAANAASGRRVPREVVSAHDEARAIVETAKKRAEAMLAEARAGVSDVAHAAATEARASETARLAARFLALELRDARRAERDLDRAIELAVVLAERLIGGAIAQEPARVVVLARQALAETRGARRATIAAHPDDVQALRTNLEALGIAKNELSIAEDATLGRGSLTITTDVGSLDAKLTPQLERLAAALRDALEQP